jgi:hypothetical protein
VAAIAGGGRTLTGAGGEAERIPGQAVTWQFFDTLGIRPIAGVTFTAEDTAKRRTVVVISERLWKNRFGSDPSIVGRMLSIDDDVVHDHRRGPGLVSDSPSSRRCVTLFSVRRSSRNSGPATTCRSSAG